eukprot:12852897-Heterocapsa_arctica.AAC.1
MSTIVSSSSRRWRRKKGERHFVHGRKGQGKLRALHVHQNSQEGPGSGGKATAGFPPGVGRSGRNAARIGGGNRSGTQSGRSKGVQCGQGKGPAGRCTGADHRPRTRAGG